MGEFLNRSASPELIGMVREKFGMLPLTNAHGEWLNILVDIGLLGCVSFIGMMVSAIVRFLRHGALDATVDAESEANAESDVAGEKYWGKMIVGACGLCLLAYTANNTFSFQQSMSTPTIFVILGIGEAFMREQLKQQ